MRQVWKTYGTLFCLTALLVVGAGCKDKGTFADLGTRNVNGGSEIVNPSGIADYLVNLVGANTPRLTISNAGPFTYTATMPPQLGNLLPTGPPNSWDIALNANTLIQDSTGSISIYRSGVLWREVPVTVLVRSSFAPELGVTFPAVFFPCAANAEFNNIHPARIHNPFLNMSLLLV